MNNGLFSPFGPFLFGAEISETFFNTWVREMDAYRYEQEARLQQHVLGTVSDEQAFLRINHVAAGIRAFFDQNQPLTMVSRAFPMVQLAELYLARRAVRAFQQAEHNVRHELPVHVPLSDWEASGSYRDELGQMASSDPQVYQMVSSLGDLPKEQRQQVAHELADRLQAEHVARHPSQTQMS